MGDFFKQLLLTLAEGFKALLSFLAMQLGLLTGLNGWLALTISLFLLLVLWRLTALILRFIRPTKQTPELKNNYFDKEKHYNEQLHRVQLGGYQLKSLLNKTEQAARNGILEALYDANLQSTLKLFAQVSLGEILTHPNKQLFQDINSKRVDFVLTDNDYIPVAVIEIHGQGHYLSKDSTQRDQIKQIVIEGVGMIYVGIATGSNYKQIQLAVKEAVLKQVLC